jgi:hypothetical protein
VKKNPFRRPVPETQDTVYESPDLSDDQLDLIAGGVSYFARHEDHVDGIAGGVFARNDGNADDVIKPELPILAQRPSDNLDLWF